MKLVLALIAISNVALAADNTLQKAEQNGAATTKSGGAITTQPTQSDTTQAVPAEMEGAKRLPQNQQPQNAADKELQSTGPSMDEE